PTSQCSFCIFLIKTLESLLPKERTEVSHLLEEVCVILPSSYRDECQAVIDRFGKTLLDALMRYVTPEAVCALIHLCKGQEAPLMGTSVTPRLP
uniref:Saposin B-type domain-containing protein n=1 Tax=Myripristis murdjan TaxID=586833 RepID=A0A667XG82_9TELE